MNKFELKEDGMYLNDTKVKGVTAFNMNGKVTDVTQVSLTFFTKVVGIDYDEPKDLGPKHQEEAI